MIKITCFGHTKEWLSREEAVRFYVRCLREATDDDSKERLSIVLDKLLNGDSEIDDFS